MGAMGRSRTPSSKGGPDSVVGWHRLPNTYFVDLGARPQGAAGVEDGQRSRCQEPGQEAGGLAKSDGEPGQVRATWPMWGPLPVPPRPHPCMGSVVGPVAARLVQTKALYESGYRTSSIYSFISS